MVNKNYKGCIEMLSKHDVYEFIDKVEAKALKTVNESYISDLDKAIKYALNQPENDELRNAIKSMENHVAVAVKAQEIIRKFIPRFRENLYNRDLIKELFRYYEWNFPDGFDGIKLVHAEYAEKLRRVEEEYAKIKRIVKNKKTGDQGKTALIALGFDVAYLDKLSTLPVVINEDEIKVDKSLLFPCGTSGVE